MSAKWLKILFYPNIKTGVLSRRKKDTETVSNGKRLLTRIFRFKDIKKITRNVFIRILHALWMMMGQEIKITKTTISSSSHDCEAFA